MTRGGIFALTCKIIENDFKLGNDKDALEKIERLLTLWPGQEEGYLLKIRYAVAHKDRQEIRRVLMQIEEKEIYLSPEGRKIIAFWQEDKVRNGS